MEIARQDTRYQQLRHTMKKSLSEYLKVDNEILDLQKKMNKLKKDKSQYEKTLSGVGEILNLENEHLRYHNEVIDFSYSSPKLGLSNNVIKLSLENYFNTTNEWRRFPVDTLVETLLTKISDQKDLLATTKKKNLKIKRVPNKK